VSSTFPAGGRNTWSSKLSEALISPRFLVVDGWASGYNSSSLMMEPIIGARQSVGKLKNFALDDLLSQKWIVQEKLFFGPFFAWN